MSSKMEKVLVIDKVRLFNETYKEVARFAKLLTEKHTDVYMCMARSLTDREGLQEEIQEAYRKLLYSSKYIWDTESEMKKATTDEDVVKFPDLENVVEKCREVYKEHLRDIKVFYTICGVYDETKFEKIDEDMIDELENKTKVYLNPKTDSYMYMDMDGIRGNVFEFVLRVAELNVRVYTTMGKLTEMLHDPDSLYAYVSHKQMMDIHDSYLRNANLIWNTYSDLNIDIPDGDKITHPNVKYAIFACESAYLACKHYCETIELLASSNGKGTTEGHSEDALLKVMEKVEDNAEEE